MSYTIPMNIKRIYYSGDLQEGATVSLDAQTRHYLLRVLRCKEGETVILFNGNNNEYTGSLIEITKQSAIVQIHSYKICATESSLFIELAQGISRSSKMDYVLQKAVELGVNRIVPLITERCGVTLNEDRLHNRLNHWKGIVISACEQSRRCVIPELVTPQPINHFLNISEDNLKFVCNPKSTHTLKSFRDQNVQKITLLIGPEGGFSDSELAGAENAGFNSISLGPRILRTETATVAALSLIQYQFGDF